MILNVKTKHVLRTGTVSCSEDVPCNMRAVKGVKVYRIARVRVMDCQAIHVANQRDDRYCYHYNMDYIFTANDFPLTLSWCVPLCLVICLCTG